MSVSFYPMASIGLSPILVLSSVVLGDSQGLQHFFFHFVSYLKNKTYKYMYSHFPTQNFISLCNRIHTYLRPYDIRFSQTIVILNRNTESKQLTYCAI